MGSMMSRSEGNRAICFRMARNLAATLTADDIHGAERPSTVEVMHWLAMIGHDYGHYACHFSGRSGDGTPIAHVFAPTDSMPVANCEAVHQFAELVETFAREREAIGSRPILSPTIPEREPDGILIIDRTIPDRRSPLARFFFPRPPTRYPAGDLRIYLSAEGNPGLLRIIMRNDNILPNDESVMEVVYSGNFLTTLNYLRENRSSANGKGILSFTDGNWYESAAEYWANCTPLDEIDAASPQNPSFRRSTRNPGKKPGLWTGVKPGLWTGVKPGLVIFEPGFPNYHFEGDPSIPSQEDEPHA